MVGLYVPYVPNDPLHAHVWLQAQVPYDGGSKSRADFMAQRPDGGKLFIECKSVTLAQDASAGEHEVLAMFPDTASLRAQRHLQVRKAPADDPHMRCIASVASSMHH